MPHRLAPRNAVPLLLTLLLWVPLSLIVTRVSPSEVPKAPVPAVAVSLPQEPPVSLKQGSAVSAASASLAGAVSGPPDRLSAVRVPSHLMAGEGANRLAPAGPDAVAAVVAVGASRLGCPRRVDPYSLISCSGCYQSGSRAPPTRPVATV
jgi:hypothetical protein